MADLTPSSFFPLIINANTHHTPHDGSPAATACLLDDAGILRA
jgi:hypothetical protein